MVILNVSTPLPPLMISTPSTLIPLVVTLLVPLTVYSDPAAGPVIVSVPVPESRLSTPLQVMPEVVKTLLPLITISSSLPTTVMALSPAPPDIL